MGEAVPAAYRQLAELDRVVRKAVADAGVDQRIVELVKVRASMLNGCSFCVDLHSHEAREKGEDEQRLLLLAAWPHAAHLYTEQEQAALVLTEALTRLPDARDVPDAAYERAAAAFTPEQLAAVAWVATTINTFNRLGVLGRKTPPKR